MTQSLSDIEARILSVAHLQAEAPVAQIAEESGLKPHTVRRCLLKLRQRDMIRFSPFVDIYRLGLAYYAILFSLAIQRRRERQDLLNYLLDSERVGLVIELGGDYHYGMSVVGRSIFDVGRFLTEINSRFGDIFFEKAIAARSHIADFRHKALFGNRHALRAVHRAVTSEQVTIDETDHHILSRFSSGVFTK